MIDEKPIRIRFNAVGSPLDERGRRLHAAAEAGSAGHGGVAGGGAAAHGGGGVAGATRGAGSRVGRGLKALGKPASLTGRVRRHGAGRKALAVKDATLLADLERLLEPATMGDPMRPLRWVSKSHEKLAAALRGMDHQVSAWNCQEFRVGPR